MPETTRRTRVRTIEWTRGRVVMIDQRLLPVREVYRVYSNYREVARAIKDMVIRGAPAIGVANEPSAFLITRCEAFSIASTLRIPCG